MNTLKTYSVVIFGQPFTLVSDESREEVEYVASQVDDLMQTISRESGVSDPKKVAILAAVKLLCRAREREQSVTQIDAKCQELITVIDATL